MLVISIRAGGRGLNLPAANHVFHFDRWWNPAVEQQATDRAYRFGQHKDVFVHSLICTATLEERIDELLDSKRELAEKVVAGRADDWLGELDLDAIRAAVALVGHVGRGGGMTLLDEGRPIFVGGDDERIGRGPWARWVATSVVPDEGSPRAERGRDPRPHRARPQRLGRRRAISALRDRIERRRVPGHADGRPGPPSRLGGRDRVAARPLAVRGAPPPAASSRSSSST